MSNDNNTDIISAENVEFSYTSDDGEGNITYRKALNGIDLTIKKGSYTAILGPNGSGKSTLAKLIDVLELPDSGVVTVLGKNTSDEKVFWDIREHCACVFQNPDNQIVGTIVEEEVAFGPENLGIPLPELRDRVDRALEYVGLTKLRDREAANLSGGQKQKLAVAGCLAMEPDILIMDESTSMLDPVSRDELLQIVERLNREKGITVITITHDMTEASRCDYIYVIRNGKVSMSGTPSEIFSEDESLKAAHLALPIHIALTKKIAEICNITLKAAELESTKTCEDAAVKALIAYGGEMLPPPEETSRTDHNTKLLSVTELSFSYDDNKTYAIKDMNLEVYSGEILAIVGRTGCGKTTLISHLNGINRPQSGDVTITIDGRKLSVNNKKDIPEIRRNVGLVFQYPEYQLFEESVYKDVIYGIRKLNLTEEEKHERARKAVLEVGLTEDILDKSPFELSGGQKRRVAMAGVLIMEPKVLVLDEPAAGLDPEGRERMFTLIRELKKNGRTIILVSHNMDEAFANADRICTITDGRISACDTPEGLFEDESKVKTMGIERPLLYEFSEKIKETLRKELPGITFGRIKRTPEAEAFNIAYDTYKYIRGMS